VEKNKFFIGVLVAFVLGLCSAGFYINVRKTGELEQLNQRIGELESGIDSRQSIIDGITERTESRQRELETIVNRTGERLQGNVGTYAAARQIITGLTASLEELEDYVIRGRAGSGGSGDMGRVED
jgi:hypothetical protein